MDARSANETTGANETAEAAKAHEAAMAHRPDGSDRPPRLTDDTMVVAKDGRRHSWRSIKLLLATLIISTLGDGFCSVMMSVALPNISETYHVSLATANWVTVGYAVVAATAVMTAASALARIGLKRLFFWSRILLIASSAIGLCSVDFPMMLTSRLIQAVGAGLMFPTINTVIIRVVPPERSGRIISLNSSIIGVGIAVAPLLSGVFLTYVSLTSMYVVPLVIGVVSLVMGCRYAFDVEARRDAPIDVLSVALAFVGLAMVMLGFSELTDRPPLAAAMLVAGLGVLAVFVRRQRRLRTPLLDLRPLRHAYVSVGVLLFLAAGMGQQAILLLLPLYLERACSYTPFVAGFFLLVLTLAYAGAVLYAGRCVDRHGMWPIVSVGFALLTVGLFAIFGTAPLRVAWLVVAIGAFAIVGDSFVNVPDKDVIFESLPDAQVPDASSIFSTGSQIAGSLGSALFVGILSADVLRRTDAGAGRRLAYAYGFQHAVLVGAAIEAVMFAVSLWYSLRMVRHGHNRVTPAAAMRSVSPASSTAVLADASSAATSPSHPASSAAARGVSRGFD